MLKKSTRQVCIMALFFFINLSSATLSDIINLCEGNFNNNSFNKIDNIKPESIEVELNNYRKWQKNNLNIYLNQDKSADIYLKFKKKFKADLIVNFNSNIRCRFRASIRQSGDHRDHFKFADGNFFQSIDVDLKNGHINGITEFKLLIPETKGFSKGGHKNFEDEIVITEIYRALGFISPRTFMVDVKLNNKLSKMIFQEKAEKEMLEYHKRREGPILEGDEKYKFTWYDENKHLFPSITKENEKSIRKKLSILEGGLSKQTNVDWAIKSPKHLEISEIALTKLNRIYLKFIDQKQYNFYYNFSMFNLDNSLLANNNKKQTLEWDIFTAIALSTSRGHGLVPHNRKFYWNSINEFFEPIYYDGDVYLDFSTLPHMQIPFSLISSKSIKIAKDRLNKIKIDSLFNKIKLQGSTYSKKLLEKKIKNIILNLNNLSENRNTNKKKDYVIVPIPDNYDFTKEYLLFTNDELNYYQSEKQHRVKVQKKNSPLTKKIWGDYISLHSEIVPKLKFVINNAKKKVYVACKNNNKKFKCEEINFTIEELKELLRNKHEKNSNIYQYIGKYEHFDKLENIQKSKYNKIKIGNSFFFFEKNINFNFDEKKNKLIIYQTKPGAKAFFNNGEIENLNINFYGYDKKIDSIIPNYPFDLRGLTGCLTFTNVKLKNVEINSSSSTCEDAINFINVTGQIKIINIKNSYSDGLDMDFSNVQIDNLIISSSKNDCIDVSYGEYNLNKLDLVNCGDKALSVGEKSILKLNEILAENVSIGIASKDSSKTLINKVELKNLKTCLAAYNKKQEFSGGLLNIKNISCINFDNKIYADAQSLIVIENEF